MQVKIIKDYKKMKVNDMPNVDDAYGKFLIEKKKVAEKAPEPKKK